MTTKTEIKTSLILSGKGVKMTGYSDNTRCYTYEVTPEALAKIQAKYSRLIKAN